jgi:hypothetical protein
VHAIRAEEKRLEDEVSAKLLADERRVQVKRLEDERLADERRVEDERLAVEKVEEKKHISCLKEICENRFYRILYNRDEEAALQFDRQHNAQKRLVIYRGVMYFKTLTSEDSWKTAFENKSTVRNIRWVYAGKSDEGRADGFEVAFHYDGEYSNNKFLAQAEISFNQDKKIKFTEYTVITGLDEVKEVVGRGIRSRHGSNPKQEAENMKLVDRRIKVLNRRRQADAIRLIDECFDTGKYLMNNSCVWKRFDREKLIQHFEAEFRNHSEMSDYKILKEFVTAERVEYSYRGRRNGNQFDGFCSTSFTPEGKILSESWRTCQEIPVTTQQPTKSQSQPTNRTNSGCIAS